MIEPKDWAKLKRTLLAKELREAAERITQPYHWWGHRGVTKDAVFHDIQALPRGTAGHEETWGAAGPVHSVFFLLFLAEALEDPTWCL